MHLELILLSTGFWIRYVMLQKWLGTFRDKEEVGRFAKLLLKFIQSLLKWDFRCLITQWVCSSGIHQRAQASACGAGRDKASGAKLPGETGSSSLQSNSHRAGQSRAVCLLPAVPTSLVAIQACIFFNITAWALLWKWVLRFHVQASSTQKQQGH